MKREILPLISCLMPTIPERELLRNKSVEYFLNQDYPNKELIILGTNKKYIEPVNDNIRYVLCEKEDLQSKIKIGLQEAKGDIIARWDDDDIQPSYRLLMQLKALGTHRGVGLNHGIFYDYRSSEYFYSPPIPGNMWDSSLMFYKKEYGEDTRDTKNFVTIDDISIITFGLDQYSHLNTLPHNRFKKYYLDL